MKVVFYKTIYLIFIFVILGFTACSNHTSRKRSFEELLPSSQGVIVKHKYYTLAYSEHHEGVMRHVFDFLAGIVSGLCLFQRYSAIGSGV